jgi:farnesyl-diphosphate farnesyltransferase
MSPSEAADQALLETSRTFYLPIVRLPSNLREAVTASYLCLRAIDEIEDHIGLTSDKKSVLLQTISTACAARDLCALERAVNTREDLASVTKRMVEWIQLAPSAVAPWILQVSGRMAERMDHWARLRWRISTRNDLDSYTFDVAGSIGVLLTDLWYWHDRTVANKLHAVGFGRGLQAVNILRNRTDDLARGVDFFPIGWNQDSICLYAQSNLSLASNYVDSLSVGPARDFCQLPLDLAYATLQALQRGEEKLSRSAVMQLVASSTDRKTAHRLPNKEMMLLVNENDEVVGVEEKIRTHQLGALHRAFSIFVFNSDGDLLLQKRAGTKYHSRRLWSNTCCGHPRFEESIKDACHRRLRQEMGIDCDLNEILAFRYRAELEDGLIEHEYDHVFIGLFDGTPQPDPNEVEDWRWEAFSQARSDAKQNPSEYTRWFSTAASLLAERIGELDHSPTRGKERESPEGRLLPACAMDHEADSFFANSPREGNKT